MKAPCPETEFSKPFSIIVPAAFQAAYEGCQSAPAVRQDDQIFVLGIIGLDGRKQMPQGFRDQDEIVFAAEMILGEAGSDLADVASLTRNHVADLEMQMGSSLPS